VIPHFAPEPADPPGGALHPNGARSPKPYFLYAGRLEPIKGVDFLIDAFRRQRSHDLVIAGAGVMDRRLRRRAADLPHVHFRGWLPQQQLSALYQEALAVVMPTLGHEVFGLVALEAFAQGTPVITRRFGALDEIVEATGAGLTFGSAGELDAALQRIASDPGLREELGRRGRIAARDRFSIDAHLRRYMLLIERLAHERGTDDLAAAAGDAAPRLAAAAD
jgi:glycosyltransferase involved in cell wall biosynthesis